EPTSFSPAERLGENASWAAQRERLIAEYPTCSILPFLEGLIKFDGAQGILEGTLAHVPDPFFSILHPLHFSLLQGPLRPPPGDAGRPATARSKRGIPR